jgi:hypothetical protein
LEVIFLFLKKGNLHLIDPKLLEMAIRNIVEQNTCGTSEDAFGEETGKVPCFVLYSTDLTLLLVDM